MSLTEFTSDFMDAARREYESRGNQLDDDDNEAAVDELLSLATADQEAEELARRADEEAYIKRLESGEATSSTTSVVQEEVHVQSQGISPRHLTFTWLRMLKSSLNLRTLVHRKTKKLVNTNERTTTGTRTRAKKTTKTATAKLLLRKKVADTIPLQEAKNRLQPTSAKNESTSSGRKRPFPFNFGLRLLLDSRRVRQNYL